MPLLQHALDTTTAVCLPTPLPLATLAPRCLTTLPPCLHDTLPTVHPAPPIPYHPAHASFCTSTRPSKARQDTAFPSRGRLQQRREGKARRRRARAGVRQKATPASTPLLPRPRRCSRPLVTATSLSIGVASSPLSTSPPPSVALSE